MVEFNTANIERLVEEDDVTDKALKIAAQKHEKEHKKDGHQVKIIKEKEHFNENEENAIDQIKKMEGHPETKEYNIATAQGASSYSTADSSYGGHSEHSSGAACTCGWIATPENAMKEFLQIKDSKNSKEQSTSAYKKDDLEDVANTYSSPLEGSAHGTYK